jgi:hypothetical protein
MKNALALGLVHVRLDLGEIEHDRAFGIEQPHRIFGPDRPGRHVLQRREGGSALRIELDLVAAGRGIDAEGERTGLVAGGVGDFPGADHAPRGFARRRRLRLADTGGKAKRDQNESHAPRHEKSMMIEPGRRLSRQLRCVMPRPRSRRCRIRMNATTTVVTTAASVATASQAPA